MMRLMTSQHADRGLEAATNGRVSHCRILHLLGTAAHTSVLHAIPQSSVASIDT
jgi:hypothetical protein